MTQLMAAKRGEITQKMQAVAAREGKTPEEIAAGVARGEIVIPANPAHVGLRPCGVGKGLRTKVNANIGTSEGSPDLAAEVVKLEAALAAGTDAVMDLSTGGEIDAIRRALIARCPVPLGTVPVYQAAAEALSRRGAVVGMEVDDLFAVVEKQMTDGVDFITVHAGLTMANLELMRSQGRITEIVSRGGALLVGWMLYHGRENPFYAHFDRLLELAAAHDVTLSLGDSLRPGCLADATDRAQIGELITLGELARRAREAGVQVMIEGPGHMRLDEIALNVALEKKLCESAPFYVLGPLVTDVAPGYDDLTAAIGGAIAAAAGADFLCYVTSAEHLRLPNAEEVRRGVIAARIAAHAGDLVKGIPGAAEWDRRMAVARKSLDWEEQIRLAIDPEGARRIIGQGEPAHGEGCTMCGPYCAMKLVSEFLGTPVASCR
ncbi:MAG: phosphomethylpyrimidine synthase ThiC [Firmicutes bacterium]|nr:phosphomethylpyrimidine synthase ThiC [Bacillota bacterium]